MKEEQTRRFSARTPARLLLRKLLSQNAIERAEAVREFDSLLPGDARQLLAPVARRHRTGPLVPRVFLSLSLLSFVVFPIFTFSALRRPWNIPDLAWYGAALLTILFVLYGFVTLSLLKRLASTISLSSNKGATGLLLRLQDHAAKTRAWREINLELETAISECLTRLLGRFEKSDYSLLDRHERALLLNLIVGDRREPAHAAVEAVARLGDPEDMAFLARIADSPPAGWKRWTVFPGMRERAMHGILKIDERRRREEAGGNLLRPCEAPKEEILLRTPASAEVESSCLLHPL